MTSDAPNTSDPKMNRRRLLAISAALSLAPSLALAQATKKIEKLICGESNLFENGFHQLHYRLVDKQITELEGKIRIDMMLDGKQAQEREFDIFLQDSEWAEQVKIDVNRRLKLIDSTPGLRDKAQLEKDLHWLMASRTFQADQGWIDIKFKSLPGRIDQIWPVEYGFRMPPLGNIVGVGREVVNIEVLIDGQVAFILPYKLSEKERSMNGNGPAPQVRLKTDMSKPVATQEDKIVRLLSDALLRNVQIAFQAVGSDGTVFLKMKPSGNFHYASEIKNLMTMQPEAANAAQRAINGSVTACTKEGCFLTTAAVGAVGLSDDCWELQTLRAYRDGYLSTNKPGQALIADYYKFAPEIVAKINARADSRQIWLRTYALSIIPTALCARIGWHGLALKLYARMIKKLNRFAPI